jgi:methylglutaconyl-CoA hydratase
VHRVVPAAELPAAADAMLATLGQNSLAAMADAKALIRDVTGRPLDAGLRRATAERIARARASDDGRGRIAAFLENRGQRG